MDHLIPQPGTSEKSFPGSRFERSERHRAMAVLVVDTLFDVHFFFNDTATTEIYTLSLHDALPIYGDGEVGVEVERPGQDLGDPRDLDAEAEREGVLVVVDEVRLVGLLGRGRGLPGVEIGRAHV